MNIEEEIQAKGLTAPRLTIEIIKDRISERDFHVFGGRFTVCVLTLVNGYMVSGESSCVSPENYDQEIGEKIAFENALDKIWALEGYLLRQKLYVEEV